MTVVLLLVTIAVAAYLTWSAVRTWSNPERYYTLQTFRAIRPWMPIACLAHLAVVIFLLEILLKFPVLQFGWYRLISGRSGNALLAQSANDGSAVLKAFSIAIPIVLAFAVPREARAEENMFRMGNHQRRWDQRLLRAILFGLMHLLVGVPIAAAVALILSGIFYDLVYICTLGHKLASHGLRLVDHPTHEGQDVEGSSNALTRRVLAREALSAASAVHSINNYVILALVVFFAASRL